MRSASEEELCRWLDETKVITKIADAFFCDQDERQAAST
jgi:hypothetical protein